MKRTVLVLAAALLAAAAMTTNAFARHDAAPPTLKAGVLTVGLSLQVPGFQVGTIYGGNKIKNAKGMEPELAKAIAKKLGIAKVEFINNDFQTMYAPGPKKWDFGFAEMTITEERKGNIDFSTPYLQADQSLMVRKGLSPLPKSTADVRKLVLCAQTGTTGADFIKGKIKPTTTPLFPKNTEQMYTLVRSGKCDGALYDAPINGLESKSKPGKYGPIVARYKTGELYGAPFAKGSKMLPLVNAALKALIADGTVGKLAKQYLNFDASKIPVFKF